MPAEAIRLKAKALDLANGSKVLFDYGVSILGGAVVTDPVTVLHYVGQGSSLHKVPSLLRFTLMKH
jgi:hypothetical protein